MLLKDIKRKTGLFSTRLLKRLSVSAVFVYIIQENSFLRFKLWEIISVNDYLCSPLLIVRWGEAVVLLFIAAMVLDYLVEKIYSKWW